MSKKLKVLVLIDCQNDFITGSLANLEAQKAIPNIINKIKNNTWDYIFLTRDTHDSNYLSSKEGKELPVEHCIENSKGWQIEKTILTALLENKINYNINYINKFTFGTTKIGELLTNILKASEDTNNEVDIEICGFCTDICVISNTLMLKAQLYNVANITVDAECCAGITPEKHKAALEVMKSCQIKIINE